jgi:hypothetical protein
MANYGGEIDINDNAEGQFAFYAPSGSTSFNVNYVNGANPVTVSGRDGNPPAPTTQSPGSSETYQIPNPEAGVLVKYNGQLTLQWNWWS